MLQKKLSRVPYLAEGRRGLGADEMKLHARPHEGKPFLSVDVNLEDCGRFYAAIESLSEAGVVFALPQDAVIEYVGAEDAEPESEVLP
jgi:hypothetical protein